nr:transcription elongation factor SPT6-like isoform X1 [Tanacetum cinerariifolium]
MKIAELKQISSRLDVILFLCLGRSDYMNGGRHGGRHDALLSGVPRPYSGGSRRGRGRGSHNKGYDGRSKKSKDGEGVYGSFPGAKTQNST